MPRTSTCPKCEETIVLVEAPSASLVECPLCRERFELADALDFVAESDDADGAPELVVVEIRESEEPEEDEEFQEPGEAAPAEDQPAGDATEAADADAAVLAEAADEELPAKEPPAEESVQVRCPCCRDAFPLKDLLLAETDEPLGTEAAAAIRPDGSVGDALDPAEAMALRFGNAEDDEHSEFKLESVEEEPKAPVEAFEFAPPAAASDEGGNGAETGRARRRRRERGGLKDFVGAIVGGAAGLLITYYLLNLFGGARFDMLGVYLPFVEHTAVHRPGWLGGPPEEEEFDSGIGDAMGQGTKESQSTSKPEKNEKATGEPGSEKPGQKPAEKSVPAEESGLPADYVGLMDPPEVTSAELGQALREIDQLAESGPLTEEGYEAWCRAAVAATFLDRSDGDPQTHNRLDAMRRLLGELTIEDVTKIGQLATRRAVNPDRRNHGILLAGTPRKPNTENGQGYLTGIVVAGTGAQLVVASDRRLPIQPEDRVLLLGYLVDQPQEALHGLDTELPQVTWSRTVVEFGQ